MKQADEARAAEQRQRQRISEQIDLAVSQTVDLPLLNLTLKQIVGTRYLGGEHSRLQELIERAMDAAVRAHIERWLKERDDEIYDAIVERLTEAHIKPLAQEITDQFIEDFAKGRK